MAISTFKVFLMHKPSDGGEYQKLIDVKSFPDLGGTPEMLETTTLSNMMQTFIKGIQSLDSFDFEANYDATEYANLKAIQDADEEGDFAVWFGGTVSGTTVTPTGEDGKFSFKGTLSVFPTGGGVNEVIGMTISFAPSSPIAFEAGA